MNNLIILKLFGLVIFVTGSWASYSADADSHLNEICSVSEKDFDLLKDAIAKLTLGAAGVEFCNASKKGHLITVELLLDIQPDINEKIMREGIMEASKKGHFRIVEVVFERRSDVLSYFTSRGLVEACKFGHFAMVKLLLGNSSNIVPCFVGEGLIESCKNGDFNLVELLISKRNDIFADHAGKGLIEALKIRHVQILIYLLEQRSDIALHVLQELFENKYLNVFRSILKDSNASAVGQILAVASASAHSDFIKMILDSRADIDNSSITKVLLVASRKGRTEVLTILFNSRCQIDASAIGQALIEASKTGHLNAVKAIIESNPDDITDGIAGEALLVASENRRLETFEFLLNSNYTIDVSFKRQSLFVASKNNHLEIYKRLLECMNDNDVELVRQARIDAIRTIRNSNNVSFKRVGLINNLKCCRIISLVTCLFNIHRFREVFYASDFKTELSVKLAELFVQMQLGTANIDMEDSFVQYLKYFYPDYKRTFWGLILKLRNRIFEIFPEETKNLFQVSLRISDTGNPDAETVDIIKNFITISRRYKSISKAISSNFRSDVRNVFIEKVSILPESQEEKDFKTIQKYNHIEILNRPEILMFAIISSMAENTNILDLDYELEIPSTSESSVEGTGHSTKYILKAFSYSDRPHIHHMSFVRDFSQDPIQGDWFRYNDNTVSATVDEKHQKSLKNYANSTASFAIYVRSDKCT